MARIRTIKPEFFRHETDLGVMAFSTETYLYCVCEIGTEDTGPCKLGIAQSVSKRLSNLQCGNWRPLTIVWAIKFKGQELAGSMEARCLGNLRPSVYAVDDRKRLCSEWVEASPTKALSVVSRFLEVAGESLVKEAAA